VIRWRLLTPLRGSTVTSATAGVLQREIGVAPAALGFTYDTGLYLQSRATNADDFQLGYAATLSDVAEYSDADRLVGQVLEGRPDWLLNGRPPSPRCDESVGSAAPDRRHWNMKSRMKRVIRRR
jgi:hypothetical protein